jgi:hypothetical protein
VGGVVGRRERDPAVDDEHVADVAGGQDGTAQMKRSHVRRR